MDPTQRCPTRERKLVLVRKPRYLVRIRHWKTVDSDVLPNGGRSQNAGNIYVCNR